MDDAGARCCLHIVGKVDRRIAAVALMHVVERVLETHPLKESTFGSGDDRARQTVAFQGFFNKAFAEDEITIADIHQGVGEVGVHVKRLIGRDGPRGRCPNDNRTGLFNRMAEDTLYALMILISERKSDVKHRGLAVHVFDFSFCQGGLAVKAPVDRLQTTINVALFHDLAQRRDFRCFRVMAHRAVRVVPQAQNA